MIITMTGRPCSGKSVIIEYLVANHGFKRFSAGEIYRRVAQERGIDVLDLNRLHDYSVDKLVDSEIIKYAKQHFEEDIIFDSRIAWHFVPESFKVYVDVDDDEQVRRFLNVHRDTEITNVSPEEAKKRLDERWKLENDRYMDMYGFNNLDKSQYDLVINNTTSTVEESAEKIYNGYLQYVKSRENN
ncbi:MAG: cytidylate kinase family protein [Clostridia bacterium]|nr:cytidylate kinase family protein [Clostridia bacterium]